MSNLIPSLGQPYGSSKGVLLSPTQSVGKAAPSDGGTFQGLILNALKDAGDKENNAQGVIARGIENNEPALTESVLAMREADLAMRLMLQVQLKLVNAWNELRNMQL